jgi:4-amino-4-deoxy-L-arabinose transferase-like glycosyltransferase
MRMTTQHSHTLRDVALIVGLVLLAGAPSLFTRDLWNPDEPRYCEVAREMLVTGHCLVPHLNGDVYPEKGPVFFWLAAGLWKLGAGYLSGRLVTLLSVAGTLVLLYLAFRKAVSDDGALLAAVITPTTLLMFGFVRLGVPDPLMTFTVTAAIVSGFFAMLPETRRRGTCWLLCYAAVALSVLNKGPVGFIVPGLTLLAYGILNRKRIRPGGWWHLAGPALLALIVAAWLVPACIAGGKEYTDVILVRQTIGRAVHSYSHRKPFYFYLEHAVGCFAPWVVIAPLAVAAAIRSHRRGGESVPLLATVWFIVPIVFFSLMSGKRVNYVVPVTPALGLLCGWYFTSKAREEMGCRRAELWLLRTACVLIMLVCLTLAAVLTAHESGAWKAILGSSDLDAELREFLMWLTPARVALGVALCALSLAAGVAAFFLAARNTVKGVLVLVAAVLLIGIPLDVAVVPVVNHVESGRNFSETVNRNAGASGRVYMFTDDFSGVFNLYTGRLRIPVIKNREDLRSLLGSPDVFVITRMKDAEAALGPETAEGHVIYHEGVGQDAMVLLKGGPTASEK